MEEIEIETGVLHPGTDNRVAQLRRTALKMEVLNAGVCRSRVPLSHA
jgi:hypothetical protein